MKFQLSSVVALTAISSAAGVACGSASVDDILAGNMVGFAEAQVTLPAKTCTPEQESCIFGICVCTTAAQLSVDVDGLPGSPCSSMFDDWCDSDGCKAGVEKTGDNADGTVCCDGFGNFDGTCATSSGADLLVTREFGSSKECASASSGDGGTSYNGDQGSAVYASVRVEKKADVNITTAGLMVTFSAGKLGDNEATCVTELKVAACGSSGAAAMAPSAVLVASLLLLGASQM